METFYVLRYPAGTDVKDALHSHTLGRYDSWLAAEAARAGKPQPWASMLEVLPRTTERQAVPA